MQTETQASFKIRISPNFVVQCSSLVMCAEMHVLGRAQCALNHISLGETALQESVYHVELRTKCAQGEVLTRRIFMRFFFKKMWRI